MTRRRVVLLGATGSIGRQACDVIARFPDRFELVGAVAGRDAGALAAVLQRFVRLGTPLRKSRNLHELIEPHELLVRHRKVRLWPLSSSVRRADSA